MTEIRLDRRSTPDRLRYLAGKLREGEDRWASAVALSLDAMADEMENPPLRPGETRYFPGGNSVHMHTGPDCPCGSYENRGGGGSAPRPPGITGWPLRQETAEPGEGR